MAEIEKDDYERLLEEMLQDPEFREAWEADEAEYQMRCAIIEARIETGMTQQQLAEAVGVTRQTINAIERGDYNPTIKLCLAICHALDRTLDELFWED